MSRIELIPLEGIPEVRAGDDLAALIAAAAESTGIGRQPGDVLVVTQKVVSKAEGRVVELASVEPSDFAVAWAERWAKDARQVELVLRESAAIVRMGPGGLIISRTRHGFVCANAGVDLSNVGMQEVATLLPLDPDGSAAALRARLGVPVVISDSFGRPWRNGIVNVAIGVAGLEAVVDLRGRDKVGGWFVRAGDGFRMYANESQNMGASFIADCTVIRPGVQPMHVEANFRVENGQIVSLFLQPS